MEGPDAGAPVVGLPERVDRRVRLGPFPSARDALKFVGYAAAGAVLVPFTSPFAWVPVLAIGFAVSAWRPDGEAVDARVGRWLVFQLQGRGGLPLRTRGPLPRVRGCVAALASGQRVTVVRTGGTPLAYRPPAELAVMFERFRDLLRASEGSLVLRATTAPLRDGPVLPGNAPCSVAEQSARSGYGELVMVLCRRRRSRRVEISIGTSGHSPESDRRLEEQARSLADQLASLGLRPVLLADRALAESIRGFGWSVPRGSA
ncbi:MAG: hypothetical protein L3K02_01170 [Thermoplasmata archaeon]|nr:hypothetical protein [Thermoplasmata archaeon]